MDQELCPIHFSDAPGVLAWADELLSKSARQDSIGKLLMKPSSISLEELRDWALTASSLFAGIRPIEQSYTYRFVYADPFAVPLNELLDALERRMRMYDEGKDKTPFKLRMLAFAMLKAVRHERDKGGRYPHAKIARQVGITRQALTNKAWRNLMNKTKSLICGWTDSTDRRYQEMLADAGFTISYLKQEE